MAYCAAVQEALQRVSHPWLGFTWDGWNDVDFMVIDYLNVEFDVRFGAFKAREKVEVLTVDYQEGCLKVYSDEGEVVKEQRFTGVPSKRSR